MPGRAAAEFLIEYLGVKREELAAFGDGHNDTGLLRFAGIGFAVANASECFGGMQVSGGSDRAV